MYPELNETVNIDIFTKNNKVLKYSVNCNGKLKKCKVCFDVATAFNFSGLSCESCKAFFRRHAHRLEKLTCHNNNNCEIDIENRRFCKRCRLQKCFDIGMDKSLLLTQRRRGKFSNKNLLEILTSSPQGALIRHFPDEEKILIYNPETPSPIDLFNRSSSPSSSPSFSSSSFPVQQLTMQQLFQQNCLEIIRKLPELLQEKPPGVPVIVGHARELTSIFTSQEFFIPGLITFNNFLVPFHQLNKLDQLAVLKQSFPQIMMLRSTFYFNFEKDAFLCRQKADCTEVFYVDLKFFYKESQRLENLHRELAHIIREELQFDTVIRDLLTLLIIFRPNNSISCPEFLRYHYFKYCHLLANYLSVKHSTSGCSEDVDKRRVAKRYNRLVKLLDMLSLLSDIYYSHYQTVNKMKISQTLGEIYETEKCV